ncbi:hypothetical protein [Shinella zoogloeoides]|uniref:hypothetical protein n=1 Tax=Shinella zoogloeoides TaxID=352475 RepID=UPI00299E8640|nr:hypothetical protein [Shinella zoogloeoides]WPE19946.1 hypothetical protein ShzoTeo12_11260 [Shinella zoogloeoides]
MFDWIGWWLAPFFITVLAWIWHFWINRENPFGFARGFLAEMLIYVVTGALALIVTLLAWLVFLLLA